MLKTLPEGFRCGQIASMRLGKEDHMHHDPPKTVSGLYYMKNELRNSDGTGTCSAA